MTNHLFSLALVFALAAIANCARSQADPAQWKQFQQLTATQKELVAAKIAKELPESALLRSLRACVEKSTEPHAERCKRFAERHGKRVLYEAPDTAMPHAVRYAFGLGVIERLQRSTATNPKAEAAEHAAEDLAVSVHQALLGIAPGADRALARLMYKLDTDTRADEFAAFLHAWRNGDESFYEALDRTAGTKDSVFFYDAMLGDFRSQFGGGDGAPAMGRGLKAAHDDLHDAFLAYRQYRGFREAVAWSLVLPPGRAMPKRLQRYETDVPGAYSLRQQVVMVCDLFDGDVERVIDEIVRSAPALPEPVWKGTYDPYPAWSTVFNTQLPRMIEASSTSDEFLARAVARRTEEANAIIAIAQAAIEQQCKSPTAPTRH
ncbi:MAG TPA: hypothetical protein VFD82_05575 [Planctomycetota bacterium]|nr:hypothetical protein [Planctomycetota bacterium]